MSRYMKIWETLGKKVLLKKSVRLEIINLKSKNVCNKVFVYKLL